MTARDEPPDPQEVLEAAEAAHLAGRPTVPIPERPGRESGREREPDPARQTVRLPRAGERETVRLDRETTRLPRQRPPVEARRRAPLALAAGVAAGWAAVLTLLPITILVTLLLSAEPGPLGTDAPARVAAAGWLLAHGVPTETGAGPIGLAPLALTAFAGWRMIRAGVHVTRARGARDSGSLPQALAVAAAVAAGYGVVGVLVAAVASGPGWGADLPRAGLTLAGFGFVAAGYGAVRATGADRRLRSGVPPLLRAGGRAGVVAAAGVLAAGAAGAGTALAVNGGHAADVLAAYRTGVAGQAGLTLLCLVYAPNLAGWAVAYLVGPGFAVGTQTVVSSSEVVTGPLPAVPVFAALPTGPLPSVGAALLVAPVLAGGLAGWLLARTFHRPAAGDRWWQAAWVRLGAAAVVAGGVAGFLLGGLALISGGPLGEGQLATLGPAPLPVALSTAATVTVGALLGAAAGAGPVRRRG